jgi:hypothetical protein
MSGKTAPLFTTRPHGEDQIDLLEDASRPNDRIYEVRDLYEAGSAVRLLGGEIASVCEWWANEKIRAGNDSEDL